jgi:signal transduction histidine kinase
MIGVMIISRHPRHIVGWLILIVGFFAALANSPLDLLVQEYSPSSRLAYGLSRWVGHLVWIPEFFIPISLMLQFFPDGRLPSPRWWPIPVTTLIGMCGFAASLAFYPWPWEAQEIFDSYNPFGIAGSARFFELLAVLSNIFFAIGMIGALAAVVVRFRRSQGIERNQIKWLVYTAVVGISAILFFAVIGDLDSPIFDLLFLSLPALMGMVIGIAILRHRLFDIDIVIQRTLVYGVLTALIVVIYIAIVGILGAIFHTQINAISGLAATAVIAVLFQPLRNHLQRAANRLLYGERDDPTAVLTQLAQQVETADTPAAILPNLVKTIAHTLKIPHVAVWLPTHLDRFEPVAAWGQSPENVEIIPLTYHNEEIGQLVVAPRSANEHFDNRERQLLNGIAALTANTVRAVQLSTELRHSRQRIVSAREEERRRLRRDLHDGLGPQLASQTLGLEAVEQLMPTNPQKAYELLASLKGQAQEAITDVRRLVYELRPPTLDDLGLAGALQQSAARLENDTLQFAFDIAEPLPDLPAAVETAVYRITQEAMTNVVRHADARHVTIHIACTARQICVVICDDGQGLSAEQQSGVGLQSMRERAAELNGSCIIESMSDGGTKVVTQLPLEVSDE